MNKVALITGAGGYIGSETSVTLAKQGIKIAVCDINEETIRQTLCVLNKPRLSQYPHTASGLSLSNLHYFASTLKELPHFAAAPLMLYVKVYSVAIQKSFLRLRLYLLNHRDLI